MKEKTTENNDSLAPKKSLGQNFLTSMAAVAHIVEAADIKKGEYILEIGPGKGVLTQHLLETGAQVIAIEKDHRLIPYLQGLFKDQLEKEKLKLIEGDILEYDLNELFEGKGTYKLVANIPYYITGQIMRKFLSASVRPTRIVLLVQREVARRIVAKNKKESLLSLSIKAYGSPKIKSVVKAGSFFPKPNVDSAILIIESISGEFFTDFQEEAYFTLLHAAFSQKRKLLRRNLEGIYTRNAIEAAFNECSLPPMIRAEDLSLNDWKYLCKTLEIKPHIKVFGRKEENQKIIT